MPTLRSHRQDYLINAGFSRSESSELSRQYSMSQFRSLPYLRDMIRTRRLYVGRLKSLNYSDKEIKSSIEYLYYKNQWLDNDGNPDIWTLLKKFRKASIQSGDYTPPRKKGSHHKLISREDLKGQKTRRGKVTFDKAQILRDRLSLVNLNLRSAQGEYRDRLLTEKTQLLRRIKGLK